MIVEAELNVSLSGVNVCGVCNLSVGAGAGFDDSVRVR